jgi:hypothetical protein
MTLTDRGVHPALAEGARLFFAGEYQQVLAALDPPGGFGADVPLQVHVHLFRAAALYTLFARSHESDQTLRTKALAEIEQCRQIDSAFQPDPRVFAPSFISFHNGTADPGRARAPPEPRSSLAATSLAETRPAGRLISCSITGSQAGKQARPVAKCSTPRAAPLAGCQTINEAS